MRITHTLIAALSGLTLLAAATPAEAGINKRQAHQQQRIARGVENGSLTGREAARLQRHQAHIARYEARSRADGFGLSRAERHRIGHMQRNASWNIRRQRHDAQSGW
jgi:hypothetical protein